MTQKRVRWKLVSSFPKNLDTIYGAAEVLARRVGELTGGRFEIRCSQAGELVGGFEVFDAVRGDGVAEMAHTAGYYFTGKNAALAFDSAVPFGLGARQHMAWLSSAGGLERIREVLSDFGLVNLHGGNTGVQMGGWFRKPLGSLDDLKGLRMRIPGLGGIIMNRLGATAQNISGNEIYTSLERGVIDATEWVGPYDDERLGFHQVANFYHYPGWWEPGPALSFYINQKEWDRLPKAYQSALEVAAREAGVHMLNDYDAKNPAALERLLEAGVQLVPFPEDVMRAAQKETDALLAEYAQESAFKKVYDHWDAFRKASDRWFSTAEFQYQSFVTKKG